MSTQDTVNGTFESLASIFMLFNCIKAYRDKKIRGISVISMVFFSLWSIWNPYYYHSLNQFWSCVGACSMVTTNVTYVAMAIYYIWKEKRHGEAK